jgi:hypothetical protein
MPDFAAVLKDGVSASALCSRRSSWRSCSGWVLSCPCSHWLSPDQEPPEPLCHGDRTNPQNSEPILIEPCSGFESVGRSGRQASLNQPSVHTCAGKVRQGRDAGGRNEQFPELGIGLCRGGPHSARPHNRVRGGCRGGDADRFGGEARRARSLARRRWGYGVGSVAQVRGAAAYVSIEVGRSLTGPAAPRR